VKVVRKTVPSSGSSITETAFAELGSAPRFDVGGCVRTSETRSTAGACYCNISILRWTCRFIIKPHYQTIRFYFTQKTSETWAFFEERQPPVLHKAFKYWNI